MSFAPLSQKHIQEGDTVILYVSPETMYPVKVTKEGKFDTKYGQIVFQDMIGKPYGSKVFSPKKKTPIYALQPSPELWTRCLPHRTQILYLSDIAFITNMLHIIPGTTVLEAGTGSGSFTHSLARNVAPNGKVITCEFHPTRAEKAKSEFEEHGIVDVVTVFHRDVCKDGFPECANSSVDAVFLDLPSPWQAIPHVTKTLVPHKVTRICCFSPSIEQVNQTAEALKKARWREFRMFETLIRPLEVRTFNYRKVPTESDFIYSTNNDTKTQPVNENRPQVREEIKEITNEQFVVTPRSEMRGHTSYLLFAKMYPHDTQTEEAKTQKNNEVQDTTMDQ